MPALVGIALGLLLGWLQGGELAGIGNVRLRHLTVLIAIFFAQAAVRGRLYAAGTAGGGAVLVWGILSLAAVVVAVRSVPHVRGLSMIVVGWLFNLLVVSVNDGMPVGGPHGFLSSNMTFYHQLSAVDRLQFLADVLPAWAWMVSMGDVIALVGCCVVIAGAMTNDRAV